MSKAPILLLLAVGSLSLGGCVYEEEVVHLSRGPAYYGGYVDSGDYYRGPYYVYGDRRYYCVDGRYRYYDGSQAVYVDTLPFGARYITPQQFYRNQQGIDRYKIQQAEYRALAKQERKVDQQRINQYRQQQELNQQAVNQQKVNQWQLQQKQRQYLIQQKEAQLRYQQQAAAKAKKKKDEDYHR